MQGTRIRQFSGSSAPRTERHESLATVHSPAGRHHAADGGRFCWWASSPIVQLPVSALPEVDYPTIQVITFYPGAIPDVMASSVTAPLERQFGQVPGLSQMTSTSSFGQLGHHAAVQSGSEHRCRRAGGAGGDQCRGNFSAARSAESADLQQSKSGGLADSHACSDLRHAAAFERLKTWPTLRWRRRFRSSPAWDWSPSAADRSRLCAFRPIPPRWLRMD